jgi:hypothetical protein
MACSPSAGREPCPLTCTVHVLVLFGPTTLVAGVILTMFNAASAWMFCTVMGFALRLMTVSVIFLLSVGLLNLSCFGFVITPIWPARTGSAVTIVGQAFSQTSPIPSLSSSVLVRVGYGATVVAGIAYPILITVPILLARVGYGGTVVAGIAYPVTVPILLARVGCGATVVAGIAYPILITVPILLARVGCGGTVVAGIAYPVTVPILLARVGCGGTVVNTIWDTVIVRIQ